MNTGRRKPSYTTADKRKLMRQRYADMMEARVSHPLLRWIAIGDSRTCERCASLSGKVFRVNDPGFPNHLPPIHGTCRCRISPVMTWEHTGAVWTVAEVFGAEHPETL